MPRPKISNITSNTSETWTPLGPGSVFTPTYGAVTGRVTSIALDPSDVSGNKLYIGTTGGGVWQAQNAASTSAPVQFFPLTDDIDVWNGLNTNNSINGLTQSISIGALTVQPGDTGVVLAGTGDPNDALDSYYGGGLLRSANAGATWSLIQQSSDVEQGTGSNDFRFLGLAFAGFAWSTVSQQTVVAAVSQAYEYTLVSNQPVFDAAAGIYYSKDGGNTWLFAQVTDPGGATVQGPNSPAAGGWGISATSVVWNPIRNVFIAALQNHGYYQSADGASWTKLSDQPIANYSASLCPTNAGQLGSPACPIFRGVLAVNPTTGDTFAWSVDDENQDQGLWRDSCALSGNTCGNTAITFATQLSTAALDTSTSLGPATVQFGDYNLTLAAIPSGSDTLVFAGDTDIWKCSVAPNATSCTWRNTTNALTCAAAQVGPYQHALAWDTSNPVEVFIGNDSGLWRSMDDVGVSETGPVCSPGSTDNLHFQNLNAGLGSLAEVNSMAISPSTPDTVLTGLGVLGATGVLGSSAPSTQWQQVLSGQGGPVAIDPIDPNIWYVNNGAGVSIHSCNSSTLCTQSDFGVSPAVGYSDVSGDGQSMTEPAPFIVDPLDHTQLIVGTCRIWRGPATGGWTSANAVSPVFDPAGSSDCASNALVSTIAALPLSGGGEVVYVGIYGSQDGGGSLPGHILTATLEANGTWTAWTDLTLNPVANDTLAMNNQGDTVSSIYVDPHDATGQTVYATIQGLQTATVPIETLYGSTNGGAQWNEFNSNLPKAPANSVIVDPVNPGIVYVATDLGVFATTQVGACLVANSDCWQQYGAGLPIAPAVALSTVQPSGGAGTLVAGTYGRGIWQIPLLSSNVQSTTATLMPMSLNFGSQQISTLSAPQTLTVTNTGQNPLSIIAIPITGTNPGDFTETSQCTQQPIAVNGTCTISVYFAPEALGARSAVITVEGNISSGNLTATLSGTGISATAVSVAPDTISFGNVAVNSTSAPEQVTVQNTSSAAVSISNISFNGPFSLASNVCGTSVAANSSCAISVQFTPTAAATANGSMTIATGDGNFTVILSGTGVSAPTETLSTTSLTLPPTIIGQTSVPTSVYPSVVTITNSGGSTLTGISIAITSQASPDPFTESSTCTAVLAANSFCTITVYFTPAVAATVTGTLAVSATNASAPPPVALSGTGINPPVITLNPTSLNFGSESVGQASAAETITVTNSGGAAMQNVGFTIIGPAASSFTVNGNNCGTTLNSGANCAVQIVFTPASAGGAAATLAVSTSTLSVKPATASLSGNGLGTALNVSPASLNFSEQTLGTASAAQTVTITNGASSAATGLTLATANPFSIASTNCGASLAAGASCTASLVFTPVATGQFTGQLSVNAASSGTGATVALTGVSGLSGALQMTPASLTFGTTGIGSASAAQTVTLTNATNGPIAGLSLAASAGFTLVNGTCGATLGPGASCTAGVEFTPGTAGAQTGTLTVTSFSLGGSSTVGLSGTGFDFVLCPSSNTACSSSNSTVTVASGQTASFTLSLTPLGGVGATFAFQCGTLPQYAGCTAPSSNVPANATGSATVSITTEEAAASTARPSRLWLLACALILVPFTRRRYRALFLAVAGLAIAISTLNGCASASTNGKSGGGGGGTTTSVAAGTYNITITATANGVSHLANVTLVVD